MATTTATQDNPVGVRSIGVNTVRYTKQMRNVGLTATVTLFALLLLLAFLMPFAYGFSTAFKDKEMIAATATGPIYPAEQRTFSYNGEDLLLYNVPIDGEIRQMAMLERSRRESTFVDPANLDAAPYVWEGRWQQLEKIWDFSPRFGNFQEAWEGVNFPILLRNTLAIALIGMVGTLVSSIVVAYAFARFPIPGKRILFLILIGTIILPRQVTLVPTYALFATIGWTGTWLPLLVPHFFANAYNVFLLRQYFLTLPRELDEAAMIDGASPLRILVAVVIPQSWPVIVAVGLFHFVFAWNDYFEPLIYLLGKDDLLPIAVGIQSFNFLYDREPHLIQATSLMALVVPVMIFFFAQGVFMRGVVITGVDK